MKAKLLLGLIFTSIVSINSYAMEITKGKLISHKEWTTGNITGSFKEIIKGKNSKFSLLPLQNQKNLELPTNLSVVMASSYAYENNGLTGTDIIFTGSSYAIIYNKTSSPQTYRIITNFSLHFDEHSGNGNNNNNNSGMNDSVTSEDVVTLDPQGEFFSMRHPVITKNFAMPGYGYTVIETNVYPEGKEAVFRTYSSLGYFEIYAENK